MAKADLPLRAEDAVAKLKRGREHTTSPVPNGKKHKSIEPVKLVKPVVNNSGVIDDVANFQRRIVGSVVYAPNKLLAKGHELNYNGVLQVRIGHKFLTGESESVRQRAVWGTEVYTDDTDLVAALNHLGYINTKKPQKDVQTSEKTTAASSAEPEAKKQSKQPSRAESEEAQKKPEDQKHAGEGSTSKKENPEETKTNGTSKTKLIQKKPHDLLVELLLLPPLQKYTGSLQNGINSRSWLTRHDGISYMVLGKPKEMPAGWAHAGKELMRARYEALKELRDLDPRSIAYADAPLV